MKARVGLWYRGFYVVFVVFLSVFVVCLLMFLMVLLLCVCSVFDGAVCSPLQPRTPARRPRLLVLLGRELVENLLQRGLRDGVLLNAQFHFARLHGGEH